MSFFRETTIEMILRRFPSETQIVVMSRESYPYCIIWVEGNAVPELIVVSEQDLQQLENMGYKVIRQENTTSEEWNALISPVFEQLTQITQKSS